MARGPTISISSRTVASLSLHTCQMQVKHKSTSQQIEQYDARKAAS